MDAPRRSCNHPLLVEESGLISKGSMHDGLSEKMGLFGHWPSSPSVTEYPQGSLARPREGASGTDTCSLWNTTLVVFETLEAL